MARRTIKKSVARLDRTGAAALDAAEILAAVGEAILPL
jgi:hypothetical protein